MFTAIGFALVFAGIVLLPANPFLGVGLFCGGAYLINEASIVSEERFMGTLFILAALNLVLAMIFG